MTGGSAGSGGGERAVQSQPGKLHGVAKMLEKGMVARKVEMGPETDATGNMKPGKRNIKGQKPLTAVPPITSANLRSRGYTGVALVMKADNDLNKSNPRGIADGKMDGEMVKGR